jgi:hypothetical protein
LKYGEVVGTGGNWWELVGTGGNWWELVGTGGKWVIGTLTDSSDEFNFYHFHIIYYLMIIRY